jgi:hypothetical protein
VLSIKINKDDKDEFKPDILIVSSGSIKRSEKDSSRVNIVEGKRISSPSSIITKYDIRVTF